MSQSIEQIKAQWASIEAIRASRGETEPTENVKIISVEEDERDGIPFVEVVIQDWNEGQTKMVWDRGMPYPLVHVDMPSDIFDAERARIMMRNGFDRAEWSKWE